jgi:hypothetical protein
MPTIMHEKKTKGDLKKKKNLNYATILSSSTLVQKNLSKYTEASPVIPGLFCAD